MLKYLHSCDYEELIARVSFCAFIGFCFYLLVNRAVFSVVMKYFDNGVYFQCINSCNYSLFNYGGMKMPRKPLFNGPIMTFVRKHKLIRRTALVGGMVVGLYFAGVAMGWWPNILG